MRRLKKMSAGEWEALKCLTLVQTSRANAGRSERARGRAFPTSLRSDRLVICDRLSVSVCHVILSMSKLRLTVNRVGAKQLYHSPNGRGRCFTMGDWWTGWVAAQGRVNMQASVSDKSKDAITDRTIQ